MKAPTTIRSIFFLLLAPALYSQSNSSKEGGEVRIFLTRDAQTEKVRLNAQTSAVSASIEFSDIPAYDCLFYCYNKTSNTMHDTYDLWVWYVPDVKLTTMNDRKCFQAQPHQFQFLPTATSKQKLFPVILTNKFSHYQFYGSAIFNENSAILEVEGIEGLPIPANKSILRIQLDKLIFR